MKAFLPILLLSLGLSGLGLAETVPKKKSSPSKKSDSPAKSGSSPSSSAKSGTAAKKAGSGSSANSKSSESTGEKVTPKTGSEPKGSDIVNEGPEAGGPRLAAVSSIETDEIDGFDNYAPQIKELVRKALGLTKQNLTYTFGSADPKRGGMDCSGTIYFLLNDFGFKGVPRQSDEMAGWVQDKTLLHRIQKADSLTHAEFGSLQPGNLIFWSGTYVTAPRKIPVTHVMVYLGKLKKSGKPVVFGASDGRAYQGQRRTGVSVFDLTLPRSTGTASIYGYGLIPGVGKIEVKAPVEIVQTPPADKLPPKESPVAAATLGSATKKASEEAARDTQMSSSEPVAKQAGQMAALDAVKTAEAKTGGENPGKGASETKTKTRSDNGNRKPEAKTMASSPADDRADKVASDTKTAVTSKPKTSTKPKTSVSKSTSGTSRKATKPATQGTMGKAKSRASGFLEEVRKALPSGR